MCIRDPSMYTSPLKITTNSIVYVSITEKPTRYIYKSECNSPPNHAEFSEQNVIEKLSGRLCSV